MFKVSWISISSGVIAFVLAALMINHGLVNSRMPSGPGLTLDESFNIDQGAYLVDALSQHGPLLFTPSVAKDVFGSDRYLPDHPPLGRALLGTSHQLTSWLIPGSEDCTHNVPAARLGSCLAFGMTVLLLSEFALRRYGTATGIAVAAMLIGMPNVIGHARIAALESATNLAWVAAMIPLLSWWTGTKAPSNKQAIISGVLWGLLMLTKVQGILLPPIVFVWAVWRFRVHAVRPLACWTIIGSIVFFAGWPWLWLNPVDNIMSYLGRTTERTTLYCWYFGKRYADKVVPWHYPFVMTLISLPFWTILGLAMRLTRNKPDAVEQLILLSVAGPLLVFALPGTPVYDGTRLFLVVMPSLVLLAARGFAAYLHGAAHLNIPGRAANESLPVATVARRWAKRQWFKAGVWSLLLVASGGRIMTPYAVSQYGLLAGKNSGAAYVGMEASYWSDALNGDFWRQIPEDSTVMVAPVSHQFQLSYIETLVPIVRQRNIHLVPFEYDPTKQKGLLLLIHRLADLRESLRTVPEGATVIAQVDVDGVILARLIDTTNATWTETP